VLLEAHDQFPNAVAAYRRGCLAGDVAACEAASMPPP
jgi:hypothetical protein